MSVWSYSIFLCFSFQVSTTPESHKYYMPAENASNTTELSIAGRHSLLVHNVTARCALNNTDCQPGLSLAMWMKPDIPRVNTASSRFTSTEGMMGNFDKSINFKMRNQLGVSD